MVTFVATPIGNLEDITLRTIKTLESSEILLCEDTRTTKKLIHLLKEKKFLKEGLKYTYLPFHTHNQNEFLQNTPKEFFQQNIVFLSDAGMPCISDPGVELVKFLQKHALPYDVLGGISAVTLAVAFSGFVEKEFTFLGFPPHKKQEKKDFFTKTIKMPYPLVFYESPHRLLETLEILCSINPELNMFLAKELTKKFQETWIDKAKMLYEKFQAKTIKGEWVGIISPWMQEDSKALSKEEIYLLEIPPKIKAKILAKITHQSAKEIYQSLCTDTKTI